MFVLLHPVLNGRYPFSVLFLLLCIIKCYIATLSSAYADGILDRDDKDASVTNLSGMCCMLNGGYGLLYILVANNDIDQYTLDTTRIVHHATVYPCLAHLSFASDIVV